MRLESTFFDLSSADLLNIVTDIQERRLRQNAEKYRKKISTPKQRKFDIRNELENLTEEEKETLRAALRKQGLLEGPDESPNHKH